LSTRIIGMGIVILALAGILAACGSVADAVTVDFKDICAKDDRWITSEGILALGEKTKCESIGDSEECHVQLNDPEDSTKWITVTFDVGDKANTMDNLPDNYSEKDLVVRDNSGKTVGVGDRVRVTGTASNNEAAYACRVWVRKVEAVP
jgi:hypothetical protein